VADLVKVLKALSSEPRLKMLRLLKGRSLCVKAITGKLGLTQSAASQHLRVLKEAGLVRDEKRGYWVHYSADKDAFKRHGAAVGRLFEVGGK